MENATAKIIVARIVNVHWSTAKVSNLPPPDYESGALPTELAVQIWERGRTRTGDYEVMGLGFYH